MSPGKTERKSAKMQKDALFEIFKTAFDSDTGELAWIFHQENGMNHFTWLMN